MEVTIRMVNAKYFVLENSSSVESMCFVVRAAMNMVYSSNPLTKVDEFTVSFQNEKLIDIIIYLHL
jgi:hypothetical protein